MGRTWLAVLLVAASAACLHAQSAKVVFNWAFVTRGADGSPSPIDFSERVDIKNGELFKIHIQPVQNAFVYLFLDDAEGELQILFPGTFTLFDGKSYGQGSFFVPDGESWFTLDNAKGTERFYLLASASRLKTLESLTVALQKVTANSKSTVAAKSAARQAVLDEITRQRKQHSQLTVAAEKPVTIAGGTRGINASVAKVATRIEATDFYTKTFRLEH
jgi:hypothetical protein